MPFKGGYEKLPQEEHTSTHYRDEISLWSLLFFHWMTDTFKTGNSRPLQQYDLHPVEEQNKTRFQTEKLQSLWREERRAQAQNGKTPRLWRSVLKMLPTKDVLIVVIFGMVHMIGGTLRCLLLGFILTELTSKNGNKTKIYVCAVLMGIISIGERFSSHLQRWVAEVMGARICCALKGIIYSKVRIH